MSTRLRAWLPLGAIVLLSVLIALVGAAGRDTGQPLDPTSTGELGTRGLVLLLEEMGAEVSVSDRPPPGSADVALLLADNLAVSQIDELRGWVQGGGTLVVADPLSNVAPVLAREPGGLFDEIDAETTLLPRCDLPALRLVNRIDVPVPVAYDTPPGGVGCFPTGEGSFLVARSEGQGAVVALAGPGLWVNANLNDADNAVLAVSLLAARPGTAVRFMRPPGPGEGRRSLTDLIRPSVRTGLWQLVVAFAVFAWWRSRRLGRPVTEQRLVEVPGSELVVAVGNMLHKAGRRDQAAAMMRRDLVRTLQQRLGLPQDCPPEVLVDAVAQRLGVPPQRVEAALLSPSPANDRALVALADTIESLKSEVLHA